MIFILIYIIGLPISKHCKILLKYFIRSSSIFFKDEFVNRINVLNLDILYISAVSAFPLSLTSNVFLTFDFFYYIGIKEQNLKYKYEN